MNELILYLHRVLLAISMCLKNLKKLKKLKKKFCFEIITDSQEIAKVNNQNCRGRSCVPFLQFPPVIILSTIYSKCMFTFFMKLTKNQHTKKTSDFLLLGAQIYFVKVFLPI